MRDSGVWIRWLRDFDDSCRGDCELTTPELARVFVEQRLAERLDAPPKGSRGKAYVAARESRT